MKDVENRLCDTLFDLEVDQKELKVFLDGIGLFPCLRSKLDYHAVVLHHREMKKTKGALPP